MAELLDLAGTPVSDDPAIIFEWLGTEVPLYSGLDYDSVGLLGVVPAPSPQEVTR
jgi:hypothetical protein